MARGPELVPPFSRHPTEEYRWSRGRSGRFRENRVDSSGPATSHLTEPSSGNTILYPR